MPLQVTQESEAGREAPLEVLLRLRLFNTNSLTTPQALLSEEEVFHSQDLESEGPGSQSYLCH